MKTGEKLATALKAWAASYLETVIWGENIMKAVKKKLQKKMKTYSSESKPTIKLK